MIYDCFCFYNELDMLEIRLNILDKVVDQFVLVEATKTHAGFEKKLYFEENKARFVRFLPKIIHVVTDDFKSYSTSWGYENHQRNDCVKGLSGIKPDDVVILSDVDEIPNPQKIIQFKDYPGIKLFEQDMFYYYLNYRNDTCPKWKLGSRMFHWKDFSKESHVNFSEYFVEEANLGATMTRMRWVHPDKVISKGGWHFSYCGGTDFIINKIKSFAHQEYNNFSILDAEKINKIIASGKDILNRDYTYSVVPLNEEFPEYIRENKCKYSNIIRQMNFWEVQKYKLHTLGSTVLKLVLILLSILIPYKSWRKKIRSIYKK